jgi:hypothetical protein
MNSTGINNNSVNNVGNNSVRKSNNSIVNKTVSKLNSINPYKLILLGVLVITIIAVAFFFGYKEYQSQRKKIDKSPILISNPTDLYKNTTKLTFNKDIIQPSNDGLEFTYSMWLYIADWNLNFGSWKPIIVKDTNTSSSGDHSVAPGLWFYPKTNAIHARISTTADDDTTEGCDISDFPLQKWTHLVYVLKGRSVNMYIDGKLVRSCNLLGIPKVNNAPVIVGSDTKGVFGKISKLQYFNRAVTTYEVEAIFDEGRYNLSKSNNRFFNREKISDEGSIYSSFEGILNRAQNAADAFTDSGSDSGS